MTETLAEPGRGADHGTDRGADHGAECGMETGLAAGLVRLTHLVQHVFAEVNRDFDLTPQQAQLLCMLIDGPIGMGELSRLLHLEKSSLTGLVDRVQRRGLVERVRDDRDRRACRIALTAEGVRLGNESHSAVAARLEEMGGALPRAERKRLADAIGRILIENGVPGA
ncbi:winged helix-turn-helix transcriptional regulator [Saccharopolyspora erythraea]|uniref:MarR family winged helix-turn-helix transcriptional regulator n=1 Tax=Saccharopolyspora erythraea TaxID=1836 RepID=UPI001BAD2885|nr:MarR family winged helix-turn-helix transcriptional regulator [Saccharopolyspora erythraea]QUG99769.1 winged helix-turn-helix transcriptional regulator [Saccharopolyspora erythraea]